MIGIGDIVDQRYEITQLLGAGGMGRVYKARRCAGGLSSEVAVKVLEPGVASWRFEREAQILEQLRHDNICRVLDLVQHGGQHAMVLEYLDGQPLDGVLEQQGRLSWPDAKAIAADVLAGLAEAHGRGIVHRDIKPANLMLTRTATGGTKTVIMDFGIARDQRRGESGTSSGSVVGTWRYAAPEQIKGEDLGPPCDLYALGVTLYELLTGGALFPIDIDKEYEWMHAQVHTPPDWSRLEALHGKGVTRFLQKALQKKPADRYATAQAMLEALPGIATEPASGGFSKNARQLVAPLLVRAGRLRTPAERASRPRRPGRALPVPLFLGLSGAASLAGVVFIGMALVQPNTPAPSAARPQHPPASPAPALRQTASPTPPPAPAPSAWRPAEPDAKREVRIENILPGGAGRVVHPAEREPARDAPGHGQPSRPLADDGERVVAPSRREPEAAPQRPEAAVPQRPKPQKSTSVVRIE